MEILGLHVALVADDDKAHLGVAVDLGLFEPAGDVVERLPVCDVVDKDGSGGRSVVAPGDRLEGFLSGLDSEEGTVSQIWSLMVLSPTVIILAPNSTPMVT